MGWSFRHQQIAQLPVSYPYFILTSVLSMRSSRNELNSRSVKLLVASLVMFLYERKPEGIARKYSVGLCAEDNDD